MHYSDEKITPQLSIVVTSRNDNHGEKLLYRMQHFVDGLIAQCNRQELRAELIIVEWNPPSVNPSLAEVLRFPTDNEHCPVRIIKVSEKIHQSFENSDKIPLYQMIGKNVGIRRARGRFILATNIDIIFSDEVILWMKKKLKPGYSYRVDRLDIPNVLPTTGSFSDILNYCRENAFCAHTRYGDRFLKKNSSNGITQEFREERTFDPFSVRIMRYYSPNPIIFGQRIAKKIFNRFVHVWIHKLNYSSLKRPVLKTIIKNLTQSVFKLNTNACGDFTLLSRDDWFALRGYPEWPIFSWHIDGIFLYQVEQHGIKEYEIAGDIYHIDHSGGYTPQGAADLFSRLRDKSIPFIDNLSLDDIVADLDREKGKKIYNKYNWGLIEHNLEEINV